MTFRLFSIVFLLFGLAAWPQQDPQKEKSDRDDKENSQKKDDRDDRDGRDNEKEEKGKKKKPLGATVLVQVLTTVEDSNNSGGGEQSLLQQLFLIDLSKNKPIASIALGSSSEVVLSDDHTSVWVVQRLPGARARVLNLALPDFHALADHTFPLALEVPSDAAGDMLSNQRVAQLKSGQLVLAGIDPASSDLTMALLNLSFCATTPSFRKVTPLQPQQQAFSDIFNIAPDSAMVTMPAGDALALNEQPNPGMPSCPQVIASSSPGVTPISLDPASAEVVRLATYNAHIGRLVVVTSSGFLVLRDPAAQVNTSRTETDATLPLELSVEPAGAAAAIRYFDPTVPFNGGVLVNLATAQEVANFDLPSGGAIALLDATHLLLGNGAELDEMDLSNSAAPSTKKLLVLKGVSVQRIFRLIPIPK